MGNKAGNKEGNKQGKEEGKTGENDKEKEDGKTQKKKNQEGKKGQEEGKAKDFQTMDVPELLREALKLKQRYQGAALAHTELENKILSDKAWEWAEGASHRIHLQAMSLFKDRLSDFHTEFLMATDMAVFKKRFGDATLKSGFAEFCQLSGLLDQLVTTTSSLLRAHAAMSARSSGGRACLTCWTARGEKAGEKKQGKTTRTREAAMTAMTREKRETERENC